MERTVLIDGREYKMKSSALVPRLYRFKFNRDLVQDLAQLEHKYKDAKKSGDDRRAAFSAFDLTMFENIAWIMIRHAGESIPDTPEEWLDSIEGFFSIYEILPTIFELWQFENLTTSKPKKK